MLPGVRFAAWLGQLAFGWKDTVGEWIRDWLVSWVNKTLEDLEPEAIDIIRDTLTRVSDHPATPARVKEVIGKLTAGTKPIPVIIVVLLAVVMLVPMLFSVAQPLANLLTYAEERVLHTYRVDPLAAITAWRRDPGKYAWLLDDMRDLGWSETRIEALKFYTLFYPAPRDLIGFLAHEVYEDEIAARYGLDAEISEVLKHLDKFEKAGMDETRVREYWRDHWEHASWMQVVEMLHRGLLAFSDVEAPTTREGWAARDAEGSEVMYDWFRLVEIPPFWRKKLEGSSWNVPTRVDVRRWWDMRTIDEQELRNIYHRQGYHGTDLDNYILWTKVYVAFPDLIARWSKGWITIDVVRTELTELGMPAERVEEMIQMKIKPQEPERVEEGKALTKTEIYKGVKKDVLTWDEGIELLMDLGYDYDEADYILTINVETLAGSPETFQEFKAITQKYKVATGREEKPMPEELKKAAEEVVRLTGEVEALAAAIEEEKRGLVEDEELPPAATARLEELQVARNRAISELERVKSEYDRLVAQWKHGLP